MSLFLSQAHALEEEEVQKMSGQLFAVAEKGYRLDVIQSLFGSVGWAIFQIFQVVCLGFTGFLAIKGTVMPGDITLYQSYFATIVSQVSSLMSLIPTIAKGIESVNSIGEVLLEDDIEQNEGKEIIKDIYGEFDFKRCNISDIIILTGQFCITLIFMWIKAKQLHWLGNPELVNRHS